MTSLAHPLDPKQNKEKERQKWDSVGAQNSFKLEDL
jgi:hypothetical protein